MPLSQDIYTEIKEEMSKLKDMFPYSKNNDSNNVIIEMCKRAVDEVKNRNESKPNPIQSNVKNY